MKRLIVAMVALTLALTLAPAAFAAGGSCDGTGPGGNGGGAGGGAGTQAQTRSHMARYSLSGTVKAVDAGASTLSVLVNQSNHRARAYKGDVVILRVTAATKLYQRTADGQLVSVALDAFSAGDRVTSVGTLDRSDPAAPVFTALRVTLRPALGTGTNCAD
jgi:hypothetical protein